jgi:ribosomal protein S18 acetylase RimI-like enzyme
MDIKFYHSIFDWMKTCQKYFDQDEPLFQLLITNGSYLMEHHEEKAFFGIGTSHLNIQIIFMYRPPYNLVVHPFKDICENDMMMFAKSIFSKEPQIPGINAPEMFAKSFSECFSHISRRNYTPHLQMDIMVIKSLKPVILPIVTCRLAQQSDLSFMNQWTIEFSEEALHETPDLSTVNEKNLERIAKKQCYLILDEQNNPRAMGLLTRPMKKGIAMTLVYTEKKSRGLGFGIAVAHYLSKIAFEMGYHYVSLYVDKSNPISNRVYRKVGFNVIMDQSDYRFS